MKIKEEDLFFKENLYNYLSMNDSMFNKYETDSIEEYSYMNSKNLLMNLEFKINYELYLRFKKESKYYIFTKIEKYFDLIESFLENEKINESHFLFENDKKIDITKTKINKNSIFKFSNNNDIKKIKKNIKDNLRTGSSLIGILDEIINQTCKNPDENYRIVVENYDEYLYLIKYLYTNKIKIKFIEYRYFKDYKIYKEILKFLSKNEYDKVKIKKMIVNTSDYYEHFFNYFILQMLNEFDDKMQFLFYLFLYKDLYLVKTYNEESNLEIEPLEFVSLSKRKTFLILSSKNVKLSEKELKFYLERLFAIEDNLKIYKYTKKINNENFNVLKIINDAK